MCFIMNSTKEEKEKKKKKHLQEHKIWQFPNPIFLQIFFFDVLFDIFSHFACQKEHKIW